MIYREAEISDIKQIQFVRNSVKENRLSVPGSISDEDCEEFIKIRGKGWVCEISKRIVGFAIVDIKGNNVWALFVLPEFECRGIGSELHKIMMKWYFDQTNEKIWLSTEPETRAENFYKKKVGVKLVSFKW